MNQKKWKSCKQTTPKSKFVEGPVVGSIKLWRPEVGIPAGFSTRVKLANQTEKLSLKHRQTGLLIYAYCSSDLRTPIQLGISYKVLTRHTPPKLSWGLSVPCCLSQTLMAGCLLASSLLVWFFLWDPLLWTICSEILNVSGRVEFDEPHHRSLSIRWWELKKTCVTCFTRNSLSNR